MKEDFLDFNAGLGADDLNGESGSSFDISQAVGRLGLEDDADQKTRSRSQIQIAIQNSIPEPSDPLGNT